MSENQMDPSCRTGCKGVIGSILTLLGGLLVCSSLLASDTGDGEWMLLISLVLPAIGVLMLQQYFEENRRAAQARYETHQRQLRALRISNVDNMSGQQFEEYVAELLRRRGFSVTRTPHTGDYGADMIAVRASDGASWAVQVKRRSNPVPGTAVSEVVAAKAYYGCQATMVVTNSYFTSGATELARVNHCVLVDRDTLTEWILAYSGR